MDFSNLVNAYIAIKPESRNFIKNSARAIVIGEYLKHEQASDFTALVKVISKEPIWWVALKENAAEPLVYPNVVRVAYAKFKEYLNAGKSTKKLLSPSKAA